MRNLSRYVPYCPWNTHHWYIFGQSESWSDDNIIIWVSDWQCFHFCLIPENEITTCYSLQKVSAEIRDVLNKRAANFNIALDDVSITSLTFGKEFTSAIEAKQIAAQEAERAKYIVEKAEQDKKGAIIRAQVSNIFLSSIWLLSLSLSLSLLFKFYLLGWSQECPANWWSYFQEWVIHHASKNWSCKRDSANNIKFCQHCVLECWWPFAEP